MEHEDNLNIRKKVLAWEAQPYPLDKDLLWKQRLNMPPATRRRSFVFYYAAASVVLAAAIVYYSHQATERALTQLRLKEVELSLVEADDRSQSAVQTVTVVPCPEPAQTSRRNRKPTRRVAKVEGASSLAPAPVQADPGVPETVVTMATNAESTDSKSARPIEETPVIQAQPRVILSGHSIHEKTPSPPSRLHLSLFRNDELRDTKPSSTPPVVSLAGINH